MNKILQRLLIFEKFEVQTKLSKAQISERVEEFIYNENASYYGRTSEHGFFIGEKFIKHYEFVRTRNSFAPVAKAKISEENGNTTVTTVIRMHLLPLIIFIPLYIMSLLTVVLFPLVLLFLHPTFVKPGKRLKEKIENLFIE